MDNRKFWMGARAAYALRKVGLGSATLLPALLIACGSSSPAGEGSPATVDGGGGGQNTGGGGPSGGGPGTIPGGNDAGGGGTTAGPDAGGGGGGGGGGKTDGGASGCAAAGREVVMIGDSYPALSGEIPKQLQKLAHDSGSLAASESYRTYYVSGTQMVGGLSPNIPAQYDKAIKADADIKFVIMDGGGNDILIGNSSCITSSPPPGNTGCAKTIDDTITAAKTLFAKMKADGVEKVVYYFYPHLPTQGKPYVNATLDYALPLVKAACDGAPLPCFFVDTRQAFEGHTDYIGGDGIHPTTAGSDVIAGLIWDEMKAQCVAQ